MDLSDLESVTDDLSSVKSSFLNILQNYDDSEINDIKDWFSSVAFMEEIANMRQIQKSEKILEKYAEALKKFVPVNGELPSENIVMPTVGDQSDCNTVNTCHIDGFLYNDDDVALDKLMPKWKKKFHTHYCLDCHSRNVKKLAVISHSISRTFLQFMFRVLLPSDLDGKQILDIGSRLGTVLFAANHLTNASHIIGVEMNQECCDIQNTIIRDFSLDTNKIKVIHSDVMDCKDIVADSDVVILNAVDFFADIEQHKRLWKFLAQSLKKGSYLVLTRSLADTLMGLDLMEELIDNFSVCKPCQLENEILFDIVQTNYELFLYTVK